MTAVRDTTPSAASSRSGPGERLDIALMSLLAGAALLRFYGIGSQFWIDEVSVLLHSARRSLGEIATQWPGVGSHVFYELCARLSLGAFGETPFALRLPAVLFGIASVGVLYRLAAALCGRRHGVLIAALFAVSYHHIFFSQNGRGYTALIFFFLFASQLFIEFASTKRITIPRGVAYAVACALAAYSQLVGVFTLAAHVAVAAFSWLLGRARRQPETVPVRAYFPYATLAAALTAVLYAPFVGALQGYTAQSASTPAMGPRVGVELLRVAVEGLSAALMGPAGLATAAVLGSVGLIALYRRQPLAVWVLLAPLLLQGAAFAAFGVATNPRYFAIALPIGFLVGGHGLAVTVGAIARRLPLADATRRRVEIAALAVVVLLSAVPLLRYYRLPKQDYIGAMRALERLAGESDTRAAVTIASHVINGYYGGDLAAVENLQDLRALERTGQRVWLVTTLERVGLTDDRELFQHIHDHYQLVQVLPGTFEDGAMRLYVTAPHAPR